MFISLRRKSKYQCFMSRPVRNNINAIQSYIFTTAKYDFSVYEKRIMYRMIEFAQDDIKGVMIRDHMHKIQPTLFGKDITMPVADILKNEQDQHYTLAKKAFKSLARKGIEYEDDDMWTFTNIIVNPRIDKKGRTVTFSVIDDVWRCILDFSKGYRKYELLTAMSFKSVYSMRMYELMSGQVRPLEFSIDDLKNRFGIKDKYKRPIDFKRFVLDAAKKELDIASPYSFNYVDVKHGHSIVGFKFYPTFKPEKQDAKLFEVQKRSKLTASAQISQEAYDYLRFSYGFRVTDINKNKKAIIEGELTIDDFIGFLGSLHAGARTAEKPIGYIIAAIKKKTAEIQGAKK